MTDEKKRLVLELANEISKETGSDIVLVVCRDADTKTVDVMPFGTSKTNMLIGMAAGEAAKQAVTNIVMK